MTPLTMDQALKFRSLWRTFLTLNPTGGTADEKERVPALAVFTFQHCVQTVRRAGVNTKETNGTREARQGEGV